MRRRIPYRVCSCMPNGVVTHLEARLLKDLVNQEIHPIRCAASCKRKFMKGARIGDLCAETGHFWWALKVWSFTEDLIEVKDYNDWIDVYFNTERVRLTDVISETECELLARRRSDLWRALGFPEYAWWNKQVEYLSSMYYGTYYYHLFGLKYDSYYEEPIGAFEESISERRAEQETELIFREGQGDNLSACSQYFFDYWLDGPLEEENSVL